MTTAEAVKQLKQHLSLRYDARETTAMVREIFAHLFGWTPVDIVMHEDKALPDFAPARLDAIVERLDSGEPLQYVLGKAWFHGRRYNVTPATLIPRPETEQLVDMILDLYGDRAGLRALDLGTGTGCIAVTLALDLRFPDDVTAVDISRDALAVARRNADELRAAVNLEQTDILALADDGRRYDIIVSNPPYVRMSERALMAPHVTDYEPANALFVPDDDPLLFYRAIARFAANALNNSGSLFLEINAALADDTAQTIARAGLHEVTVHNDFNARPRFITAKR